MNSIQVFKDLVAGRLAIGAGRGAGSLTLFPLTHGLPPGDQVLYQDAHARGLVVIEETSESGTVGELKVTNRGTQPVLLLEGEVLLGMKQTRVLNATILVPGLAVLHVPVSCVEVGRWHHTSQQSMGKDRLNLSPRVRRAKTESVTRASRGTGRYQSDQGAVWDGVAEVLASQSVNAPTGSYADMTRERGSDILERVRDLQPEPRQAGVLAYLGSKPTCVDVFDSHATLAAVWEALVGSYAADAEFRSSGPNTTHPRRPSEASAAKWLHGLAEGDVVMTPSIGLGENVTCIAAGIEASALFNDETLIHLAAFPAERRRGLTVFAPPARRRS